MHELKPTTICSYLTLHLLAFCMLLAAILSMSSCKKDSNFESDLTDIDSIEEFESVIAEGVSLIFFHAAWCTKCKSQRPAIEALLTDQEVQQVFIGEVDYEKVKTIVENYQINGFPTMVFYKNGTEADRLTGQGHSTATIKAKLLELL